jgi:3-deoxy-manno-octulosonate cytidylyltransferase (CMP-KDO synthetase)
MKILGVIPSRYQSSRLPGKPLKDICGRPMVWWVYNLARQVAGLTEVVVATDDKRIVEACDAYAIPNIMTSVECPTGTDRVAEVAEKMKADIYITIQGDEPLLEPSVIQTLIDLIKSDDSIPCATLKTVFKNPVDVVNGTTPKVVTDKNGDILLFSRSPIPYPKASLDYVYYKPMGVYAFRPEVLRLYQSLERGDIEKVEDIELLRLVENGVKIRIKEVHSRTVAVDTEKDLCRVIDYINAHPEMKQALQ